jgi:predicted GIY-YIG superfamily endonuclease
MTCSLYRHFDADGALLYVGITKNIETRTNQHKRSSAWFSEVASTTVEKLPSREHAEALERVAIRFENPIFNKLSKPNHDPVSASDDAVDVAQGLEAMEACAQELGVKVTTLGQMAVQNRHVYDRIKNGTAHRDTERRVLAWIKEQSEATQ